jgi:hypothetical protein
MSETKCRWCHADGNGEKGVAVVDGRAHFFVSAEFSQWVERATAFGVDVTGIVAPNRLRKRVLRFEGRTLVDETQEEFPTPEMLDEAVRVAQKTAIVAVEETTPEPKTKRARKNKGTVLRQFSAENDEQQDFSEETIDAITEAAF